MTGEIKIPFAFNRTPDESFMLQIDIEHLVFSKFENEEFKKLNVPEINLAPKEPEQILNFIIDDSTSIVSYLHFNQVVKTDGLKYWFTALNYDKQNHVLSGYLNLAVSVEDLYTTRITFNSFFED